MNKLKNLLLVLLLAGMWSSCLRDTLPDCPPLKIKLTVKDKNYFNIDDAVRQGLAVKKELDLPFREYVSTVYYALYNESGEKVFEKKNYPVKGDAQEEWLTLPASLPYGKYSISVWGNMTSERPLRDDSHTGDMQHTDAIKNDIYLANGVVDYQYGSESYTLSMNRAKGALIIKAEGLPDRIDFSAKRMSNVFSVLTDKGEYLNPTDVMTTTEWEENKNEILTHTLYCPSVEADRSSLTVAFGERGTGGVRASEDPMLVAENVNITMGRNELTILKYIYDANRDDFLIYLLVNDVWECIHDMGID